MSIAGLSRIFPPCVEPIPDPRDPGEHSAARRSVCICLAKGLGSTEVEENAEIPRVGPTEFSVSDKSSGVEGLTASQPEDIRTAMASEFQFQHPITCRVFRSLDGAEREACSASLESRNALILGSDSTPGSIAV
jgi:hypothetical protein